MKARKNSMHQHMLGRPDETPARSRHHLPNILDPPPPYIAIIARQPAPGALTLLLITSAALQPG